MNNNNNFCFVTVTNLECGIFVSANQDTDNHVNDQKKAVDYKHIVRQPEYGHPEIDESEIPPLC